MNFANHPDSEKFIHSYYSELAVSMARNNVCHASSNKLLSDFSRIALLDTNADYKQERTIVIVGAGASQAACSLLTGAEAARVLLKEVSNYTDINMINEEIEKLTWHYNLDSEDFETILLALSKFTRNSVIKMHKKFYDIRYNPWIGYEILAHMFKYRFIDAIINFNFDELLDQSILDELGEHGYEKLIMDGDSPESPEKWIDVQTQSFKLPLYIKPHGTITYPSSLRFTKDDYMTMSDDYIAIFKKLLSNDRPINIIVLGYSMQSVELNMLLRRASVGRSQNNPIRLYFFEKENDKLSKLSSQAIDHNILSIFPPDNIEIAFGLEFLWSAICKQFRPNEQPRGIERHIIISKLFNRREDHVREPNYLAHYAGERTYVEIALEVAKSKGFSSTEDWPNNRIGTYYKKHKEALTEHGLIPNPIESISAACKTLEIEEYGYGGAAVTLGMQKHARNYVNKSIVMEPKEFDGAAIKLADKALKQIRSNVQLVSDETKRLFISVLVSMYRGEEVEVVHNRFIGRNVFLRNPIKMPTLKSLQWMTQQALEKCGYEWDRLACTAKSGHWLTTQPYVEAISKSSSAKLLLVVSDTVYLDQLRKMYKANIIDEIRLLPWWLNNRNVTIFLNGNVPKFAISFERRMRTPYISPMYLEDGNDVDDAWNSFVAYWIKAKRFDSKKRDNHISKSHIDDEKIRLGKMLLKHRKIQ